MAFDFFESYKKFSSFIIFLDAILVFGNFSNIASNLSEDMKYSMGYIWNSDESFLLYVILGKVRFVLSA